MKVDLLGYKEVPVKVIPFPDGVLGQVIAEHSAQQIRDSNPHLPAANVRVAHDQEGWDIIIFLGEDIDEGIQPRYRGGGCPCGSSP